MIIPVAAMLLQVNADKPYNLYQVRNSDGVVTFLGEYGNLMACSSSAEEIRRVTHGHVPQLQEMMCIGKLHGERADPPIGLDN